MLRTVRGCVVGDVSVMRQGNSGIAAIGTIWAHVRTDQVQSNCEMAPWLSISFEPFRFSYQLRPADGVITNE